MAKKVQNKKKATLAAYEEANGLIKIKSRFKNKFTGSLNFAIKDITLKPEIFQGRPVPFASETVDKILREGYDKSQDPIILYKKGNENIVISGHSRFEAAKRLYDKKDKSIGKTIPVKFFQGEFENAIDYALIESNRSSKTEGIESDIKAYLRASTRGYGREFLKSIFKTDSYINVLKLLSFLNPDGRFIEVLSKGDNTDAKSYPYLLRNASWVGLLRQLYKELTNEHESEIFRFFYTSDKSGLKVQKKSFFERIKKKVESPYFDPKKPLRLGAEKEFDLIKERDPGYIKYQQIKAAISEFATVRLKREETLARAIIANEKTIETKIRKELTDISEAIINKSIDLAKLGANLRKEDTRLQTAGLF